jgi:hypothetical protein
VSPDDFLASRWRILALLFAVRAGMGLQYQAVEALSPLFMASRSASPISGS